MKKKLISHEVPISLLERSLGFNDYLFCLPHLMDESSVYRDFFIRCKEEGWKIIMDNSLHELGSAYDSNRLIYWLKELKPDEFIVPDVWENMEESVRNAAEWIDYLRKYDVKPIAVVQGKTLHELTECYESYKKWDYEKIAFTYGSSCYNDICPHVNIHLGKALGRIYMISVLFNSKIISSTDCIHLLGCTVPQEFSWYKDYEFIESIDTSNPIMAANDGIYYEQWGLDFKPKSNLNKIQWKGEFDEDFEKRLSHNVNYFKNFVNG